MAKRTATRKARKALETADLTLTEATADDVVGGDTSAKTSDRPTESLSLNFTKLAWTYTP
jgi:type VI protein secretion system component Hcp